MKRALFALLLFILTGCALAEMRRENEDARARIAQKEIQLEQLDTETRQLEQKQQELAKTLNAKKMTLDQLKNKLDALIEQNERLIELKKQQQLDVSELEQELEYLKHQKAAASQLQVKNDSATAKENKIKALQEDIRNYLKLGLKAKHRQNLK